MREADDQSGRRDPWLASVCAKNNVVVQAQRGDIAADGSRAPAGAPAFFLAGFPAVVPPANIFSSLRDANPRRKRAFVPSCGHAQAPGWVEKIGQTPVTSSGCPRPLRGLFGTVRPTAHASLAATRRRFLQSRGASRFCYMGKCFTTPAFRAAFSSH